MPLIYYKSKDIKDKPNDTWTYWGEYKSPDTSHHVWKKEVSDEEAERYEMESELLD